MAITLQNLFDEIHNYFPAARHEGSFTITRGRITPSLLLLENEYVAISGAGKNSGIYQADENGNLPESLNCRADVIWRLDVPEAVLQLHQEISDWTDKNAHRVLKTERLGDISQTWITDDNGLPISWQKVFAADLIPYRRMFTGVKLHE